MFHVKHLSVCRRCLSLCEICSIWRFKGLRSVSAVGLYKCIRNEKKAIVEDFPFFDILKTTHFGCFS